MTLTFTRRKGYADTEVVRGLQERNRKIEDWFYGAAMTYYNTHFREVYFDEDKKQEIFQTVFLKLWTEITNGKIMLKENAIYRQQRDGAYKPMTCTLTTFLMAFARTEFRELVRNVKEVTYGEITEAFLKNDEAIMTDADDVEAQKVRVVDDCIQSLSPRCVEVLTLFYYEGKSLDEIMLIRKDSNTSKDGLKTAKNKCMNTLRQRVSERMRMND